MSIFNFNGLIVKAETDDWGIHAVHLTKETAVTEFSHLVNDLNSSAINLRKYSITEIITYFDTLMLHWLNDSSRFPLLPSWFQPSFILNFLRRHNLEAMLKLALRNRPEYLEKFSASGIAGLKLRAVPKGIITHWMAGNVPMLGFLSLLQGILVQAPNIVKLPRSNGLVLPWLMQEIRTFDLHISAECTVRGETIADSVALLYCYQDDIKAQSRISEASKVRVLWGSDEAISMIRTLPKQFDSEDLIFGPKYSFACIGRGLLKDGDSTANLAYRLALDVSAFDQYGCNCPLMAFVEQGGEITPQHFAKTIACAMDKVVQRIPPQPISPETAYNIIDMRTEYSLEGELFTPDSTAWTVVYSKQVHLENHPKSRFLVIVPIDNISSIPSIPADRIQTVGLATLPERRNEIAELLVTAGVKRITAIGSMSTFDSPWDGYFLIDRFVNWISLR